MAVRDPRAAAAKVKSELKAGRLHQELEAELAMGHNNGPLWDRDAEAALDDLESRFGGKSKLREVQTAPQPRPRKRDGSLVSGGGHGGRRRSATPKGSTGGGQPAPAAPASPPPGGRAPAPRKPAPRRTTRRTTGAGARAFEQTGIPAAGRGGAAFALEALGLMIGLALLYLLVSNAERAGRGGAVIEQTLGIFTGIVHRFVAPGDPLAARAGTKTPAAAAGTGPYLPASDVLRGAPALGGLPRVRTTTTGVTTP